jgi:predicted metal-dependent phosphoesterase TrpH
MRFADLHLHSIYSDATYTPLELIKKAKSMDLACISLVDHDTIRGIKPTQELARLQDIELIPGIELSSEYEGLEIHILGYFINDENPRLLEKLAFLKKNRIERAYKILRRLEDLGIKLKAETIFEFAKNGVVGRLHIARAMLKQGLIGSIKEAFDKYIGDRSPAYITDFKLNPYEAIDLIKAASGIPVLAHPYILGRDELIGDFAKAGLMGLEVYYPEHTKEMIQRYLGFAKEYGLLLTGGSDCHGEAKPQVRIGSIKIPYALVEELKLAKENILR